MSVSSSPPHMIPIVPIASSKPRSCSAAVAYNAESSPLLLSALPGPRSTSPSIVSGRAAATPTG
jgi:hypothetical protein